MANKERMTYKEVLDFWETKKPIRSGKTLWLMIAMALVKADKYAWHNLRKTPTDLPRENGMYWVCVEGFDTKYTSTYWDGYVWWGYSVIAWKEIAPFVEEEE